MDKSIPPKKEIHVYIGMTPMQTDFYKKILLKKPLNATSKSAFRNVMM